MIDFALFIPTCLLVNITFGPNNLLGMTHAAGKGWRFAFLAGLGRIPPFVLMISALAIGFGVLLDTWPAAFMALKMVGASYLIYLGIRIWMAAADEVAWERVRELTLAQGFRREAIVAGSNPKAIVLMAALFPRFVDPDAYWVTYSQVGLIFLIGEVLALIAYVLIGATMASAARDKLPWMNRASAIGMVLFGILMLVAK